MNNKTAKKFRKYVNRGIEKSLRQIAGQPLKIRLKWAFRAIFKITKVS